MAGISSVGPFWCQQRGLGKVASGPNVQLSNVSQCVRQWHVRFHLFLLYFPSVLFWMVPQFNSGIAFDYHVQEAVHGYGIP